ncbi:MAG: DUF3617 domain-containing protein [Acidobacteriota bacterium]|jgi:hypothetical protein|nr:DUF3617 domain-containing protein [Acidobacteriota bacterium]
MRHTLKFPGVATAAAVCVALACGAAMAQQKVKTQQVAGEKIRVKSSIDMQGMSIPSQTQEICIPAGQDDESTIMQQLQQGQGGDNCKISNVKHSGNKFSADIKCTGEEAMTGHLEVETVGKTMRSTMDAKTSAGAMKMQSEVTRLGTACEVSQPKVARQTPQTPQMPAMPDMDACQMAYDSVKDRDLADQLEVFLTPQVDYMNGGKKVSCKKHETFDQFCDAVQTPAGFMSLDTAEPTSKRRASQGPLIDALDACGLDSDDESIAALQDELLGQAQKERLWRYQLRYGGEEAYTALAATAKKECSGRSFTNAAKRYASLCRDYGSALAGGRRRDALAAAGCTEEVAERNLCVGYGERPQAKAKAKSKRRAVEVEEVEEDAEAEDAEDPVNDTINKAKKGLRGLLGR